MKKIILAATAALALAGAATAASAASFVGSYTATYNTDANAGLDISTTDLTPGAGTGFTFPLTVGNSTSVNLFQIYTTESQVDGNDTSPLPFTLKFTFTSPSAGTGTVDGDTFGVNINANFDEGKLTWDNGGITTIDFGANGVLTIDMADVIFTKGTGTDRDLANYPYDPATVTAKFSLAAPSTSAVPEPMSWALMLTGFFGMGAAVRASRRQGASLTA